MTVKWGRGAFLRRVAAAGALILMLAGAPNRERPPPTRANQ